MWRPAFNLSHRVREYLRAAASGAAGEGVPTHGVRLLPQFHHVTISILRPPPDSASSLLSVTEVAEMSLLKLPITGVFMLAEYRIDCRNIRLWRHVNRVKEPFARV